MTILDKDGKVLSVAHLAITCVDCKKDGGH
jgi:hypothetical protein